MVQTLKTKGNAALKEKLKKQTGFTLVELLVVVAIIAILAAVAIPAFTAQMDNAKKAVDDSALSSAASMAASDYLLNGYTNDVSYLIYEHVANGTDGTRNMAVMPTNFVAGTGAGENGTLGDYSSIDLTAPTGGTAPWALYKNQYSKYTGVQIVITDGGIVKTSQWTT